MRVFDAGARDGPQTVHARVLTVPNALSLVRLLALPWIYVDLTGGRLLRGLIIAAVVAATDWLDGYTARRLDQVSRLGQLLDPLTDRLLVATVGVGLVVGGVVPLWAIVLVLGRDVVLLAGAVVFLVRGAETPPVTRVGKTATAALMLTMGWFMLGGVVDEAGAATLGGILRAAAWGTFWFGVVLYYAAGVGYARVAVDVVRGRTAEG